MTGFLENISSHIWGNGLIFLLLATGIVYTLKLKFIQFGTIPFLIKNIRSKPTGNNGISQ